MYHNEFKSNIKSGKMSKQQRGEQEDRPRHTTKRMHVEHLHMQETETDLYELLRLNKTGTIL